MQSILDWFQLEELFPLSILIGLLTFVGGQMASAGNGVHKWSKFVFVASFLIYASFGIEAWGISTVTDAMLIVMRAILAGGTAYGLGLIVLSISVFLTEYAKSTIVALTPPPRMPEPEPVVEPPPEPESLPPPPPLTREELAERAKENYAGRLQLIENAHLDELEERSARERAKQTYLHEIDGLIS